MPGSSARAVAAARASSFRSTGARIAPTAPRPGSRWSRSRTRASPSSTGIRGARKATGKRFGKAIEGNWGEADESDLLRLVDWAVRKKLATRDHIGLLGLSYGGYMTNWLLGHHPGRFAAAVSENPVLDLFSFYGEHVAGVDEPWDNFQRMLEKSPGALLHRNKAPLLLLQAEGDLRCPAGQTEIAFTMLRRLGRTVEMVRYPDEFHVMMETGRPDRRVDRLERIVDWFERYL